MDVALRAFMPMVDTAALTVGLRMAERLQQYEQYVDYWMRRPQVPVRGNAALWWQHAGRATILQCQQLTRSQASSDQSKASLGALHLLQPNQWYMHMYGRRMGLTSS